MDNRTFDIIAEGDEDLKLAIRLALRSSVFDKPRATHYKVLKLAAKTSYYVRPVVTTEDAGRANVKIADVALIAHHTTHTVEIPKGTDTLIFLSQDERDAIKLPYPMDGEQMFEFARGWLKQGATWTREPDHDGDNGRGFRVFAEDWGHVAGHHYALLAVQPVWALYGK